MPEALLNATLGHHGHHVPRVSGLGPIQNFSSSIAALHNRPTIFRYPPKKKLNLHLFLINLILPESLR